MCISGGPIGYDPRDWDAERLDGVLSRAPSEPLTDGVPTSERASSPSDALSCDPVLDGAGEGYDGCTSAPSGGGIGALCGMAYIDAPGTIMYGIMAGMGCCM